MKGFRAKAEGKNHRIRECHWVRTSVWSGAGPVERVFGGAVRGPIGRKSKVSRPPPSPLPPRSNSTTPPIFEVPQCPVSNSSPPPLGRVSRGPPGPPPDPKHRQPQYEIAGAPAPVARSHRRPAGCGPRCHRRPRCRRRLQPRLQHRPGPARGCGGYRQ